MSDGGDSTSFLRMCEFIRFFSTETWLGSGEAHIAWSHIKRLGRSKICKVALIVVAMAV
jgi:hypothetical protein